MRKRVSTYTACTICSSGYQFFFFKQKTAYEISTCLVGSEMCIGDGGKSRTTVQHTLDELAADGLMERKGTRFAAADHIYVKVPPVVQVSVPMTAGKPDTISPENRTYDSRETGLMMSEKPYPNNYNINKLKESQTKGASGELPAPYGKYQNVFLTESEYAELKEEYPDSLERLIEEMSRYIAAFGNDYVSHAAAVRMWARRDRKGTGKKGIPDYSYKEGESL